MIIKAHGRKQDGRGRGFRDLSRYLFTGSAGERNPDRVAAAETRNCWSADPATAWAEMVATWEDRHALKAAAGGRKGGQDNARPVLHLTMGWQTGEKIDTAEQMRAADELLQKLGLEGHQALYVAHQDKDHAHVHIMVNLIDPKTGRTPPVNDHLHRKLSEAAHEYRAARNERHLCPQREKNREARKASRLQYVKEAAANAWRRMTGQPEQWTVKRVKGTGPTRNVWQMLKGAAAEIEPVLSRVPGGDTTKAEILDRLAATHRKAWADHFAKGGQAAPQVEDILRAVVAQQSTFTRADLAKVIDKELGAKYDRATFDGLLAKVEADKDLVRIATDRGDRFTTRQMIDTEAALQTTAVVMANTHGHAVPQAVIDAVAAKAAAGPRALNAGQLAALHHVTASTNLAAVVGYAGAGKSTMLQHAREAWSGAGFNVIGAAYSGLAAQALQDSSGIESRTVAGLEWALKNDRMKLTARDVLVIDEAGMLGSRQLGRVLSAAHAAGSKVVLVGDYQQLQAIEQGGAFRNIVQDATIGAATIDEVQRQGGHVRQNAEAWKAYEWQRAATKDLAAGKVAEAIEAYRARGHVHEHDKRDDARAAVVAAWFAERQADPRISNVMLAGTRAEVKAMNEAARAQMMAAGLLGGHRSINAVEEVPDELPKDFKLKVAQGERLMFTKNDKRMGVKNGTLGELERIDGDKLTVRLDGDEGRRVVVDLAQYRNLAHGYAATIHKTQGITAKRVHVLATRFMNQHSAYVALSRHQESVALHYGRDDFRDGRALSKTLGREGLKLSTTDYMEPAQLKTARQAALSGDMKMIAREGSRLLASRHAAGAMLSAGRNPRTSDRRRDTSRTRDL